VRLVLSVMCVITLFLGACSSSSEETVGQSTSSMGAVTTVTGDHAEASTTAATTTTTGVVTTTSTADTTTTTVDWDRNQWLAEKGPAAMTLVEEYYSMLNSGDAVAALDLVKMEAGSVHHRSLLVGMDGANAQFSIGCSISETQPLVVCRETITDDLYGPAGIVLTGSTAYAATRSDASRLALRLSGLTACTSESYEGTTYLLDLYEWIVVAHPELESKFTGELSMGKLGIPCTAYPFRAGDDAAEVCDVVSEFIAQSDKYPVPAT
jgi:hypothetical protein